MISAAAIEHGALRMYGSLLAERELWGGTLVICCGDVSLFTGAPTAVCIAGGTALVVGASDKSIRASQREGGLDFVVSSLDEALRTLKNCIRERRPLSVGLESEATAVLNEMLERGVAPDFVIYEDTLDPVETEAVEKLVRGGAAPLDLIAADGRGSRVDAWLENKGWLEVQSTAAEGAALREWNEHLQLVLPKDDERRRRWLRQAPRYLRGARNGVHSMWLSTGEQRELNAGVGSPNNTGGGKP